MRVRRIDGDSGTISIFVAICVTGLVLFIGIAYDCGGRLRALVNADALAQEAARAGGQQIDQKSLLGDQGFLIDQGAAYDAANAYLKPYGLSVKGSRPSGPPAKTFTVVVDTEYHTVLLGLVGDSTLPVEGRGTATLVSGVEKAGAP